MCVRGRRGRDSFVCVCVCVIRFIRFIHFIQLIHPFSLPIECVHSERGRACGYLHGGIVLLLHSLLRCIASHSCESQCESVRQNLRTCNSMSPRVTTPASVQGSRRGGGRVWCVWDEWQVVHAGVQSKVSRKLFVIRSLQLPRTRGTRGARTSKSRRSGGQFLVSGLFGPYNLCVRI